MTCVLAMIYKMTKNIFSCVLFHAWTNALYSVFEIEMNLGFIVFYIVEVIAVIVICLLVKDSKTNILDS
jgi:hypothetical protein